MTFSCSETEQGVPRGHIVDVLLYELVAAAPVHGVVVTDDAEVFACRGGLRVFGAVDKTDDGAAVPVTEAVHLIQYLSNIAQCRGNSGRHIVGDGRLGRADVEVQIAGSGHRGVLGALISSNSTSSCGSGLGRSRVSHALWLIPSTTLAFSGE